MQSQRINLDNHATTPMLPEVWEAMSACAFELPGNPSSAHQEGRRARRAVEDSRERLADLLDAHPDEVIFTSGATEANNLAIFGLAGDPPGRLVSSKIEHPCVKEPLERLSKSGFELDFIPVDRRGIVSSGAFADALHSGTRLISVMLANHETGALQPIADLTAVTREQDRMIPFHCDAVQAVGKIAVRFHELGVSSLALSAHKMHGPKGIGALLLRRGQKFRPSFHGGHQQQGHRPGTEPPPLIVGMVKALEIAEEQREARYQHVLGLRDRLLRGLQQGASPLVLNSPKTNQADCVGLPHVLNVSFPGVQADVLLIKLDLAGVSCSTGSACSSGSLLPSPVLEAMGVEADVLSSAMRFSLSALLTRDEIDEAVRRIVATVRRLRDALNHG